jgi:hypothetical protein
MPKPIYAKTKKSRVSKLAQRKIPTSPNQLYRFLIEDFLLVEYPQRKILAIVQAFKDHTLLCKSVVPKSMPPFAYHGFMKYPAISKRELISKVMSNFPSSLHKSRRTIFINLWQVIGIYLSLNDLINLNAFQPFTNPCSLSFFKSNRTTKDRVLYKLGQSMNGIDLTDKCIGEKYSSVSPFELFHRVKLYPNHVLHTDSAIRDTIAANFDLKGIDRSVLFNRFMKAIGEYKVVS